MKKVKLNIDVHELGFNFLNYLNLVIVELHDIYIYIYIYRYILYLNNIVKDSNKKGIVNGSKVPNKRTWTLMVLSTS